MLSAFFASNVFLITILVIWGLILVINHISYEEDYEWSMVPTIVLAGILFFRSGERYVWNFFLENFKLGIISIILYFVIGFLWSLFKWYKFLLKNKLETIEQDKKNGYISLSKSIIPTFTDNKNLICNWITFFPISILAQLLRLIFKDIATYICQIYNKLYTKIAEHVYKDIV